MTGRRRVSLRRNVGAHDVSSPRSGGPRPPLPFPRRGRLAGFASQPRRYSGRDGDVAAASARVRDLGGDLSPARPRERADAPRDRRERCDRAPDRPRGSAVRSGPAARARRSFRRATTTSRSSSRTASSPGSRSMLTLATWLAVAVDAFPAGLDAPGCARDVRRRPRAGAARSDHRLLRPQPVARALAFPALDRAPDARRARRDRGLGRSRRVAAAAACGSSALARRRRLRRAGRHRDVRDGRRPFPRQLRRQAHRAARIVLPGDVAACPGHRRLRHLVSRC